MKPFIADACAPEFLPSLYKGLTQGAGCEVKIDSIYDISQIIANIIQILLAVAGVLAVVFIVWGGITYIMSGGESSKTSEAKSTLRNAILGLILTGSAYLIVEFLARNLSKAP